MTYFYETDVLTEKTFEFRDKIATVYDFLIELLSTQYGLWGTTNPYRVIVRYFDQANVCSGISFTYPASPNCSENGYCQVCSEEYVPVILQQAFLDGI